MYLNVSHDCGACNLTSVHNFALGFNLASGSSYALLKVMIEIIQLWGNFCLSLLFLFFVCFIVFYVSFKFTCIFTFSFI